MQSLQIRTGQISLQILDDQGEERGIFKFNPTDIESAKKVFSLQTNLSERQKEFNERSEKCTTPEERLELLSEVVTYFEDLIDDCFGKGSSQLLFGEAKTLSMFDDFITGITPYYEEASKNRMEKYNPKNKRRK